MFENVNVGDRVRLTGNGEVHEVTVIAIHDEDTYLESEHNGFNGFNATHGWTAETLTPNEPTANGTLVTLFDVAVGRERTIVRTGVKWTDINDAHAQFAWDTWMDDAKPGSVKVVYVHE